MAAEPTKELIEKIKKIHPLCRIGYSGGEHYDLLEIWRNRQANDKILHTKYHGKVFGDDFDHGEFRAIKLMEILPEDINDMSVLDIITEETKCIKTRARQLQKATEAEVDGRIDELASMIADESCSWMRRNGFSTNESMNDVNEEHKRVLSGEAYFDEPASEIVDIAHD